MLNPGTLLRDGRYRIIRPIGQGGMEAVYEAEDLSLRTKVKEALVYEASLRGTFEKEAQRLARLRHPALPNVIDHFTEQGGQYLVMEFIAGQDLAEALKQRGQPFPVPQVIGWAERLLDALDYLHQEKVIHGDIKPANIKLTPKGQIILLDFGLGGLTRHTLSGMSLKGYTPGYAPLEQVKGLRTDERSDLYSLAATLYTLLTNEAPEEPSVRQRVMAHHVPDPLRPVNELNPHVSPQFAHILARALALEPAQRFATAAEMRSQLVFPPTQPVARPPSIPPNPSVPSFVRTSFSTSFGREAKRQPTTPKWLLGALGVLALTVVSLLIIIAVNLSSNNNTPAEPAIAQATIEATIPAPIPATDTPIPSLGIGSTTISKKDQMTLLYVPEGYFPMGSAEDDPYAYDNEKPRHTVFLSAYWIDQTEVTNTMFAAFLNEMGNQEEGGTTWLEEEDTDALIEQVNGTFQPKDGYANHPVIEVSWYGATAYCQWAGRRLPTEAEWEKAAGGTDSRKWPWGNEPPDEKLANVSRYVGGTTPVGSYSAGASHYGALDMAGNVWEWINDFYDSNSYENSPKENPPGAKSNGDKVLRGGSWANTARYTRVRFRLWNDTSLRDDVRGFRCVLSPFLVP